MNKNITLSEINEAKKELENEVSKLVQSLVQDFVVRTGVEISSLNIDFSYIKIYDTPQPIDVIPTTEITLKLYSK